MLKTPLLVAAVVALCSSAIYAQTGSGGVITPPSTKPDGSVITPPSAHTDPGIEKSPDTGTDQSQLPKSPKNSRPGDTPGPGGTGMPRGTQGTDTPNAPSGPGMNPGAGSGSTR
jgi:hypothetical protein